MVNDAGACSALSLVFVYHGWPKIASMGQGAMAGIPPGVWLFVGLVETLGGVLMIVGPKALRMVAALALMAVMATAILTVHMGAGFNALAPGAGGFEFQLILLLLAHGVYIRAGGWSPFFEAYKAWVRLSDEDAEAATLF
ncbi:DoxX family membrane protein [bacterium]|nr:DoxX family membrane protein [bacterium]